jgi:hypothetical protein
VTRKRKPLRFVKSFVIRRSRWKRGDDNGGSCLLTDSGQMCCLGFYTKACGFSNDEIRNVKVPSELIDDRFTDESLTELADSLPRVQEVLAAVQRQETPLINANDSGPRGRGREKEIRRYFALAGIRVRFVD